MELCVLPRRMKKAVLVLDGVDTISNITLNGVAVGTTDNMFRTYVSTGVFLLVVRVSDWLYLQGRSSSEGFWQVELEYVDGDGSCVFENK